MKFIILATVIAFATALPSPPKEVFGEVINKCSLETEVAPEIIEKIHAHDLSFDDAKGKCFEKCLCKSIGICDDDFKLVEEKFTKHPKVPVAKVAEFAPICNKLTGDNDCETVHMRFKCLFEKVPEIIEHKALGPPPPPPVEA